MKHRPNHQATGAALLAALLFLPMLSPAADPMATFQNGAPMPFYGGAYDGIEDNNLLTNNGGNEDRNMGASPNIWVGELYRPNGNVARNHYVREVMRFDLSALHGRFASIERVTLRLHVRSVDAPAGDWVDAYLLHPDNAGWGEGTKNYQVETGASTWSHRRYPSEPWVGSEGAGSIGTDYLTPAVASVDFSPATPEGSAFDLVFTDTAAVLEWVACSGGGLLLKGRTESDRAIGFHSSESTDAAKRPQLIVEYKPGGPSGYAAWATAKGIPGEPADGDYNKDGQPNGIDFVLDRDPTAPGSPSPWEIFENNGDVVANVDLGTGGTLAPALVEISEDGKTWNPAPKAWFIGQGCNPLPTGSVGTWTVRVPASSGGITTVLFRLRYLDY